MPRAKSWQPFDEMLDWQADMIENVMDQVARNVSHNLRRQGHHVHRMSVDLTENDEMYTLQAVLPGVSPDAVDIDFAEGVLTIKAQSQEAGHAEGTRYHLRERFYGDYERTFRFPSPIDSEGIEAAYENGILTVALPKAESVKSRRIHVKKSL